MRIFASPTPRMPAAGPHRARRIDLHLRPHIGPASCYCCRLLGLPATSLAGVQVLVNGVAVPLLYVSDSQINAVAPQAASPNSSVTVQIVSSSVTAPFFQQPWWPPIRKSSKTPSAPPPPSTRMAL